MTAPRVPFVPTPEDIGLHAFPLPPLLFPTSAEIRKGLQRLSICIDTVPDAPCEKRLWVDYNGYGEQIEGLPMALLCVSLFIPTLVTPRQVMRLDHDVEHSRVCLWVKNRDANSVCIAGSRAAAEGALSDHESNSDGCLDNTIMEPAGAIVKVAPANHAGRDHDIKKFALSWDHFVKAEPFAESPR